MQTLAPNQIVASFTDEELDWLIGLFQNPIYDDETQLEKRMRERFFKGFKSMKPEPVVRQDKCVTCIHKYEEDDIPF